MIWISDYGIPFWVGGQRNKRGKWRWLWTETRIPIRAVKWGWAHGKYLQFLMKYFWQLDLRLSSGVRWRQRLCCHPRSRTGGRLEDLGGCRMFRQQPLYLWISLVGFTILFYTNVHKKQDSKCSFLSRNTEQGREIVNFWNEYSQSITCLHFSWKYSDLSWSYKCFADEICTNTENF